MDGDFLPRNTPFFPFYEVSYCGGALFNHHTFCPFLSCELADLFPETPHFTSVHIIKKDC